MAAGRHGGYRDNDLKDHDLAYSRREHNPIRNGSRHKDQEWRPIWDAKDKGRIRKKDIKEREAMNDVSRLSSSRSNSSSSGGGPRWREVSVRALDREPGELSSESGSDDAIESEIQVKGNEALKLENDIKAPLSVKKRKFSPIIWDREDKELSNIHKGSVASASSTLPPPPLPEKAFNQSPNIIPNGGVQSSAISNGIAQIFQASPVNPSLASGPHETAMSDSVVVLSSSPHQQHSGSDMEADMLEDEDYVPTTRNISASRWANEASSPVDEGEISDDEEMPNRRKKILFYKSSKISHKSSTPECGELRREGSEGRKGIPSDSDEGGIRTAFSSEDDHPSYLEKNDYMDIDEEQDNNGTSVSQSDMDSREDSDSHDMPQSEVPPQRTVNMLQGCRSVDEFERLNKIDEGTYGVVYRAKDKKSGEIVALKKVKMEKEREGFPLTSLREINILLSFHHSSIVDVKEVVVGNSLDSIFMVMEYMEHDLKGLMETMKQPFSQSEVKCLMLQLLGGVKYLHDNWVLHRDLKTSNLLLNNRGELKICDFGLSRQYGSPLKPYTHLVVTLWYRAPELLLGAKQYSTAIDMWSLGCVMAELLSKEPLFNGKTELDQLDKIFRTLGTPSETIWPGFSKLPGVKVNFVKHQYNLLRKKFPATSFTGCPVLSDSGFDLLNKLLTYDPEMRITAEAALNHEWFHEVPLPKSKDFMPTFPAQHAQDRRMRRLMKSPDPLEEQRRKELRQGGLGTGGLFS